RPQQQTLPAGFAAAPSESAQTDCAYPSPDESRRGPLAASIPAGSSSALEVQHRRSAPPGCSLALAPSTETEAPQSPADPSQPQPRSSLWLEPASPQAASPLHSSARTSAAVTSPAARPDPPRARLPAQTPAAPSGKASTTAP